MQLPSALDRVRRPEHTGENRCWPCTGVNVVLAAVAAGVVATRAVALAAVAFALSLSVVELRGYLVPYTPALTARYAPASVLRAFGKDAGEPAADLRADLADRRARAVDVDEFLTDRGVVASAGAEAANRLRLTEDFAADLRGRLAGLEAADVDEAAVAALFDADDASGVDRDYPAYEVGVRVRKWPSAAAVRTDVATHRVLAESAPGWAEVPVDQRATVFGRVRRLLPACPDCGGRLAETSESVESCCIDVEKYAVRCEDCGTHLREYDDPTRVADKGLTEA
jgi:hypothetical protein